jgi:hypothetical protein
MPPRRAKAEGGINLLTRTEATRHDGLIAAGSRSHRSMMKMWEGLLAAIERNSPDVGYFMNSSVSLLDSMGFLDQA